MKLGEPIREIECEPVQWPQQVPDPLRPAQEPAPALEPVEAVPVGGGGDAG